MRTIFVSCIWALVFIAYACADALPAPRPVAVNPTAIAEAIEKDFDGRIYIAAFGQDGKLSNGSDVVRFDKGIMSSDNCIRFGFMPAPYFLRVDGNKTYFHADMPSKEQGLMRFSGFIENDNISASAKWKQVRWYWSVDVELRFEGKRANPGDKLEATFKP
jgi:hypothetical protein